MAGISQGQVETEDNKGRTEAYSGTATTSVADVPSVAGQVISQFGLFREFNAETLEVSLDGGTSYIQLRNTDNLTWDIKGEITQIKIRTVANTVDYQMLINFEAE